jgi:iduronate 2-sulfatase
MITRRSFLLGAAGAIACSRPRRRNVLIVAFDDLRPQLGCYGDTFAHTPNIDSVAARGVTFEHAYCQQAVCGPTRASLLTGLRPDTIRVYDLNTSFRDAVPDAVTLPQHFLNHSYHTENIGKVFHGNDTMNDRRSWSVDERLHQVNKRDQYVLEANKDPVDEWKKMAATESADVPDSAYIDGRVADDAVATLGRLRGESFFLGLGFTKPHLPFAAPRKYWDLFDREKLPLAPNPERPANIGQFPVPTYSELRSYADFPDTGPIPEDKMREAMHGYYAATAYADACLGKVLNALDGLGLRDNTIVILWGDHGWHLGEHSHWGKSTNFEICTRSPLILSTPGIGTPGRTKALVEFVDIYPTLSELCGLPVGDHLEGTSVVPLLGNPGRPWKRAAFSQYPRRSRSAGQSTTAILGGDVMGYTMRTESHRYTEWRDAGGNPVEVELYDRASDPHETVNVAEKPEYREIRDKLRGMMAEGWRGALPPKETTT